MLLLLAGTTEARELAQCLADENIPATASLAGATRSPGKLALPTRIGGFGGAHGFETFLDENAISAILDATHPYAERISARSAAIAQARAIPYLQVLRPPWHAGPGDNWSEVARAEDVAKRVPPSATVFLATGRQSLPAFANLAGRRLICRRIDAPRAPFPYPNGSYHLGRPPFSVADEIALFQRLGVDFLVVKNAGGTGGWPKLEAARELGLPVILIARPSLAHVACVEDVAAAMAWVRKVTG